MFCAHYQGTKLIKPTEKLGLILIDLGSQLFSTLKEKIHVFF